MDRLGIQPAPAYPLYDRLVAAYAEPHRHYHTLEHITEMLKILGKLGSGNRSLPILQLAVWFHDAVYDPKAQDNEEASARMAEAELATLELSPSDISRIRDLILATRHTPLAAISEEAALLLDADLAILGAEEKRYKRYSEAIRKEYAHVPEQEYVVGRMKVLESFLNRPSIYQTRLMKLEGEERARQNLQQEIADLTAKLAP
jgi:predicted metal-dependent HD superfamily phosphohydrolase